MDTPNLDLVRLSSIVGGTGRVPNENELLSASNLNFYGFNPRSVGDDSYQPTHSGFSIPIDHPITSPSSFDYSRVRDVVQDMIGRITDRMVSKLNMRQLKIFRDDLLPHNPDNFNDHFDDLIGDQLPAFARDMGSVENFRLEYVALINVMRNHPTYNSNRWSDSISFWTYWMKTLSNDYFTVKIWRTILSVLSVPVSNSICKRALSVMSNAQRKCKRTPIEQLKRLMNIKLNGPSLALFDSMKMAKAWRDSGHWLSDCKVRVPQDPNRLEGDNCPSEPEEPLPPVGPPDGIIVRGD